MTFYPLATEDELHDGFRRSIEVAGRSLLLLQHEGRVYITDNYCPHAGYPMAEGQVIDNAIRCPMHGYLFELEDGLCTHHPEGPCQKLPVFTVQRSASGEVGVKL